MAGGGASVIYADTVSGPSPMHGFHNFSQAESMKLCMTLDDYELWSKTLLLMPHCLSLVGWGFGLCI